MTGAETFDVHSEVGVGLYFADVVLPGEQPFGSDTWLKFSSAYPLGRGVDLLTESAAYLAAGSYFLSPNMRLMLRQENWTGDTYSKDGVAYSTDATPSEDTYQDVDLQEDAAGARWIAGCGGTTLHLLYIEATGTELDFAVTDHPADQCVVALDGSGGPNALLSTASENAVTSWDLDMDAETLELSDSQPWAGLFVNSLDARDGWITVAHDQGLQLYESATGSTLDILDGHDIATADVSWSDGVFYVIAVTSDETGDGMADLVIALGIEDALVTEIMPLSDGTTTWAATSASIHASPGRVFVGASGVPLDGSDAHVIAWAPFALP